MIVLDEGESVEVAGSGSIAEDGLVAARLAEVVAEILLFCLCFFVRGGLDGDEDCNKALLRSHAGRVRG